jgi:hypothetical protein
MEVDMDLRGVTDIVLGWLYCLLIELFDAVRLVLKAYTQKIYSEVRRNELGTNLMAL